jgi:hypothetical protein
MQEPNWMPPTFWADGRQLFPYWIMEGLLVNRPVAITAASWYLKQVGFWHRFKLLLFWQQITGGWSAIRK